MKKWGILLLAALVGLFVLVGCQQPDLSGYVKTSDLNSTLANYALSTGTMTGTCNTCHNPDASTTNLWTLWSVAATNQQERAFSGHANGLRTVLGTATTAPSSTFNNQALLENSSVGCTKCHTTDGFVYWTVNGSQFSGAVTATTYGTGSYYDYGNAANTSVLADGSATSLALGILANTDGTNCLACHNHGGPNGLSLRVTTAVKLPSGMTSATSSTNVFDKGEGNLCVNCHQDRTDPSKLDATLSVVKTTGDTWLTPTRLEHHGPQSDFLLGVDSAGATSNVTHGYQVNGSNPTFAQSYHYVKDSCVTCHVLDNTNATAGEQSSHGMYLLTATATGTVDNIATCANCHVAGGNASAQVADTSKASFADALSTTDLSNILTAYANLLNYFGQAQYFHSASTGTTYLANATGKGPVIAQTAGVSVASAPYTYTAATTNLTDYSNRYNVNWTFNTSGYYLTVPQMQALWNLTLFAEDKSVGVHNPVFAAQILYDAITLINGDATSQGTGVSTPTALITNPWSSRPTN